MTGFIERQPLTGIDVFRLHSIRWTQALQQYFGLHTSAAEVIRIGSSIYNTQFVIFWLYPLAAIIHPFLGYQVLFSLILGEYLALALKCLWPDDRPYWWFPTTEYSQNGAPENTMFEFPETCEITSGFPSSNSVLFGATTFLLASYAMDRLKSNQLDDVNDQGVSVHIYQLAIPGVFILVNGLGIMARLFLVTNFHYQLILGFLFGVLAGKIAKIQAARLFPYKKRPANILLTMIVASFIGFVGLLVLTPWDPFWTFELGMKWCWNTHRMLSHLKHTIVFHAARITALTGGLVYSNNIASFWTNVKPLIWVEKLLTAILYVAGALFISFMISRIDDHSILFYLLFQSIATFFHTIAVSVLFPVHVSKLIHYCQVNRISFAPWKSWNEGRSQVSKTHGKYDDFILLVKGEQEEHSYINRLEMN